MRKKRLHEGCTGEGMLCGLFAALYIIPASGLSYRCHVSDCKLSCGDVDCDDVENVRELRSLGKDMAVETSKACVNHEIDKYKLVPRPS